MGEEKWREGREGRGEQGRGDDGDTRVTSGTFSSFALPSFSPTAQSQTLVLPSEPASCGTLVSHQP